MFFQVKSTEPTKPDTYEQLTTLVTALLNAECPEHRYHHHLLYTANTRLQAYGEARDYYRPFIDDTPLGHYAKLAYEKALKDYNQLYTLIRGYMHLHGELKREHWLHYFRFSAQKIERLYTFYENQRLYMEQLTIQSVFFDTLKEELLPLFHQMD